MKILLTLCLLWLLQYYYKLGGLKQNTFSHGSGGQQSKTRNQELVGSFMSPPEALRENLSPCQHSLDSGCLNPNPASSSLSLWSQISLCLSHENTSDDFGPIQVTQDNLPITNLNLIPLAKSLLSFNVTFTGSGH